MRTRQSPYPVGLKTKVEETLRCRYLVDWPIYRCLKTNIEFPQAPGGLLQFPGVQFLRTSLFSKGVVVTLRPPSTSYSITCFVEISWSGPLHTETPLHHRLLRNLWFKKTWIVDPATNDNCERRRLVARRTIRHAEAPMAPLPAVVEPAAYLSRPPKFDPYLGESPPPQTLNLRPRTAPYLHLICTLGLTWFQSPGASLTPQFHTPCTPDWPRRGEKQEQERDAGSARGLKGLGRGGVGRDRWRVRVLSMPWSLKTRTLRGRSVHRTSRLPDSTTERRLNLNRGPEPA